MSSAPTDPPAPHFSSTPDPDPDPPHLRRLHSAPTRPRPFPFGSVPRRSAPLPSPPPAAPPPSFPPPPQAPFGAPPHAVPHRPPQPPRPPPPRTYGRRSHRSRASQQDSGRPRSRHLPEVKAPASEQPIAGEPAAHAHCPPPAPLARPRLRMRGSLLGPELRIQTSS
ncbi:uncharacterized protein LOC125753997 [Canis lupus dingo]|uniref:uncharacterized protein LOC125753997 n=1 Tax=Canis lupus dingo TaxID=286419 RepID=UPI0020C47061|nr:uncharacterized protein LOC125753997 [Canis lupus dingo]